MNTYAFICLLSGVSALPNRNKVRHALKFPHRRKQSSPMGSPTLFHTERTMPSVSVLSENDDDYLQDNKYQKQKQQTLTTNDNQQDPIVEDTDQDDELIESNRVVHHQGELFRNATSNSLNNEGQEISTLNLPNRSVTFYDDNNLLTSKLSRIGISMATESLIIL